MEHENFASKGVAGTGLGLAIGALGLNLLNGGNGLGGILGGGGHCSEDHVVNRYELAMQQEIAAKDSKISLLESNIYVDLKFADVYEKLNTKIGGIESQICEQKVYNATLNSAVACIQGQIAQLASLTKVVVPNSSVCPGWGDVTVSVTPTTTPTTGA